MSQPETAQPVAAPALAAYLPRMQLHGLRGLSSAPHGQDSRSVVLFADLVGFTALAETLSAQGPRGAEELSRSVDAHFGRLTDLVLAAGGDIVAYAGDAALVCWPAADAAALPALVARAASTGLRLQRRDARDGAAALRMRVSIGVGRLTQMHLGGLDGRWLFLAAGEPIAQAAAADRLAAEGEVVLSPQAAALVEGHAEGSRLAGGALRLSVVDAAWAAEQPVHTEGTPEAPADERLRPLVLPVIAAREAAGLGTWLGEFRRVSMLFCGFGDTDPAAPDALPSLQAAVLALQAEVRRYDGEVYQLLHDDKGVTLVAAFGLPPRAHEDDAARAVQAALAMAAALRALGAEPALGAATGTLYCGAYGTRARRQFTVAGPAVNLAARLMQGAPGTVWCDAATQARAALHPGLQFTPLPPVLVKGRSEPVAVFRPSPRTAAEAPHAPAAPAAPPRGREHECGVLEAALDTLCTRGAGGLVCIEGEAGIGKSRLVRHAVSAAVARGAAVLACAGDEVEKSAAYHAWQRLFRGIAGADAAQVAARLGLMSDAQAALLPLLGPLLGLEGQLGVEPSGLGEEARAVQTRGLLVAALAHASARGPTLLTVEDAHWLDSTSLTLLLTAARSVPGLLIVLSSRPAPGNETLATLAALAGSSHLQLQPLAAQAIEQVVSNCLGVQAVPEPVLALVSERAAGNPFFSEELAYALRDYGLIRIEGGQCRLADPARELDAAFGEALAARGLPPTLLGVVNSRVDRLDEMDRFTLKVAGVIGRSFTLSVLLAVFPLQADEARLGRSLAVLQSVDLLQAEPGSDHARYRFRHAITQQVVYDAVLYQQRRELHRVVALHLEARHLEARHPNDSAASLPLLAFHWRRAEDKDKAVHYLARAGEQAFRNFANAEAVGYLQDALAWGQDSPADQRVAWELMAGRACVNWSRYAEGARHLQQGLALLGEPVPRSAPRAAAALLGQIARQTLHRWRPPTTDGRSEAERERLRTIARAHESLVEVFYIGKAALNCLYSAVRGLNLAEQAGPTPELARSSATVGAILGFVPMPVQAQIYCQRALRIAESTGDRPAIIYTALAVGAYKLGIAAWAEAETHFDRVVTESTRLGDERRRNDGILFLCDLALLRGRYPQALQHAEDVYRSSARHHDQRGMAGAIYRLALCHLLQGRTDEAATHSARMQALGWENDTEIGAVPLQALRAQVALRAGDLAAAREAARATAALLRRCTPSHHGQVYDAAGACDVLLHLLEAGQVAPAERAAFVKDAADLLATLRRLVRVFTIGRPWLDLHGGRLQRLRGRGEDALRAFRLAAEGGEALGLPHPAALAHLELAATLPAPDPARDGHRQQAQQRLQALGAAHELHRLVRAGA